MKYLVALFLFAIMCLPGFGQSLPDNDTGNGSLDTYGGLEQLPSPDGGTGFFRVGTVSHHQLLVSPDGNYLPLLSVAHANEQFIEPGVLKTRYNNDMELWAQHRGQRMLAWGFNTLGEYTSRGLPVGTYGRKDGNPVKLPFTLLLTTSYDVVNHPALLGLDEPIKDIMKGIPTSAYSGYRGILQDSFDPKWQQAYQAEVAYQANRVFTGGFKDTSWIVNITTEDSESWWAIEGTGDNPLAHYPHPAWLIAVANFQQSGYNDTKIYSKYAWADYLQQKYGTIDALNAAWGSSYSSFGDSGGYGAGSGLLDEDGRHTSWMGRDPYMLKGVNDNLKADLDAFLYQYVYQIESVAVKAIRAYDTHHLIFGPATLGGQGGYGVRPQVLQALKDAGIDGFILTYDPLTPQNVSLAASVYQQTGKPAYVQYGVTANPDSYWHGHPGFYHQPDFPTQEIRGQHYASDMANIFGAKATNSDHPIVGFTQWSLTDSSKAEYASWGLISARDNAYDGKCAVRGASKDQWGYACGGEDMDYGDFISQSMKTNLDISKRLIVEKVH